MRIGSEDCSSNLAIGEFPFYVTCTIANWQLVVAEKILIAIPTLNEAAHIEGVIRQLVGERVSPNTTLVVVDGGSADGTQEIVRTLSQELGQIALVHNPGRLQSAGINLAVSKFGSDASILLRCDAHCEYPADYAGKLLASLQRSGADSVVVPMDSGGVTCLQKAIAWVSNSPIGTGGSAHRGGATGGFVDHGHHAMIKLDSFKRAGGYDETYSHNEDAEFDCRLRALGGRIFLDSKIRLGYRPRSTIAALWRQYFNYGRGRSRTARKHPQSMRLRQLAVPVHAIVTFAAILLAPLQPLLLVWPALYLSCLAAYSILLAVRERSACALIAGPAAVVMHFSWALGFAWGILTVREPTWTRPPAEHDA